LFKQLAVKSKVNKKVSIATIEDKQKELDNKKALIVKKRDDAEDVKDLIMNFMNTLSDKEIWNKEFKGYSLANIEVHLYGCSARIYAPWGMDLQDLEKYTSIIETGCKCQFIFEIPPHNQFAMANFIKPEQVKVNDILFVPVKLKPYEFCAGLDILGKPIIFNVNESSMILIAGQTRRGKNMSAYISIVSWIYYCKPTEVMMYMFQGAKNDLIQFKDCEHVYCYTDKLNEMVIALEHIVGEMDIRKKLFEPMIKKAEGNDNLFFYNNLHHGNELPYVYVIIDEFIALMVDNAVDKKDVKDLKNEIMNYLQAVHQYGASYGVNVITIHQKPEKLLMPSFLKNMCNIRICFGFEDESCVQIVLGSTLIKKAHKLPPKKAYYSNNINNGYLYTPNMKGRIRMFIEQSIKPDHRTLLGDIKKLNAPPVVEIKDIPIEEIIESVEDKGTAPLPNSKIAVIEIEPKIDTEIEIIPEAIVKTEIIVIPEVIPYVQLSFTNVTPIENTIDDNIKNIQGYVPYNPDSTVIIDKTKIDFSKIQKYKDMNKE